MRMGWLAMFLLVMCPLAAGAEPTSLKAYGHQIEIRAGSDGFEVLEVDKKTLLTQVHINIQKIGRVEDGGFAIGSVNEGGNVCEGSIFILNLPDDAAARVDGPLDTCEIGDFQVRSERIVVETRPRASGDGQHWEWTSRGFSSPSPIKLQLKEGIAWQMVRNQRITHPSELMEYREFADQLNPRLGSARSAFLRIADGPGIVRYENGILIGTACQSHECYSTALLVVVDPISRKTYIAMKDECVPLVVAPKAVHWPLAAQQSFRTWVNAAPCSR